MFVCLIRAAEKCNKVWVTSCFEQKTGNCTKETDCTKKLLKAYGNRSKNTALFTDATTHLMASSRTPPSTQSEGDAGCVLTFYDYENVDSEVESHFLRALQRAAARSDSGDESADGASPTPSSDRCSAGTARESPLQCHLQARPSPAPSDSASLSSQSVTEDTPTTAPSPPSTNTGGEAAAPPSCMTDGSQVFLYPPPPYAHQHGAVQPTYPYMMAPPPHLLRAKMLQPHMLQQLVQPDEYTMDEAELPTVPGQGRSGDFPWPHQFVKGVPSRQGNWMHMSASMNKRWNEVMSLLTQYYSNFACLYSCNPIPVLFDCVALCTILSHSALSIGGGSIYSSPHCNLTSQHAMSSKGTVHHPPAHSMEHVCPTSSPIYTTFPVYAPPPTPWHPPPQSPQGIYTQPLQTL